MFNRIFISVYIVRILKMCIELNMFFYKTPISSLSSSHVSMNHESQYLSQSFELSLVCVMILHKHHGFCTCGRYQS